MPTDPFSEYLESIGRVPLLTAEEEIFLGHAVQEAKRIEASVPVAKRTKQHKRIIHRGKRAKDRMVSANLRLVVSVAKKWSHRQLNLEMIDLIQEGSIGLIRAVEKFDPTRGYKFSTYAYWWIRQGIGRCISSQNRMIRLPSTAGLILVRARQFAFEYHAEHGQMPPLDEIADHCGITEESMMHYLAHRNDVTSLDTPSSRRSDNDMGPLKNILPDPVSLEEPNFFDREAEAQLNGYIRSSLNETEQTIVRRRYGMDGHAPSTLMAIAKDLGISRERVRQLELKIVRKLQTSMAQSMLRKLFD